MNILFVRIARHVSRQIKSIISVRKLENTIGVIRNCKSKKNKRIDAKISGYK